MYNKGIWQKGNTSDPRSWLPPAATGDAELKKGKSTDAHTWLAPGATADTHSLQAGDTSDPRTWLAPGARADMDTGKSTKLDRNSWLAPGLPAGSLDAGRSGAMTNSYLPSGAHQQNQLKSMSSVAGAAAPSHYSSSTFNQYFSGHLSSSTFGSSNQPCHNAMPPTSQITTGIPAYGDVPPSGYHSQHNVLPGADKRTQNGVVSGYQKVPASEAAGGCERTAPSSSYSAQPYSLSDRLHHGLHVSQPPSGHQSILQPSVAASLSPAQYHHDLEAPTSTLVEAIQESSTHKPKRSPVVPSASMSPKGHLKGDVSHSESHKTVKHDQNRSQYIPSASASPVGHLIAGVSHTESHKTVKQDRNTSQYIPSASVSPIGHLQDWNTFQNLPSASASPIGHLKANVSHTESHKTVKQDQNTFQYIPSSSASPKGHPTTSVSYNESQKTVKQKQNGVGANWDLGPEDIKKNPSIRNQDYDVCPDELRQSQSTAACETTFEYDFTHPCRGTAIIINNVNFNPATYQRGRTGAKMDSNHLEETFDLLGFSVRSYMNLTYQQMMMALMEVAQEDHSKSDCLICIISSHGDQDLIKTSKYSHKVERTDLVYATDGILYVHVITSLFDENSCPSLKGKPKLFFIQACRGSNLSESAEVTDGRDDDLEDDTDWGNHSLITQNIPIYCDGLLAYSSPPGFFSFRRSTGSWFITSLCEILQTCHNDLDLEDMLTLVSHKVAYEFESNTPGVENERTHRRRVVPSIMSMLRGPVWFHPKTPQTQRIVFV